MLTILTIITNLFKQKFILLSSNMTDKDKLKIIQLTDTIPPLPLLHYSNKLNKSKYNKKKKEIYRAMKYWFEAVSFAKENLPV